MRRFEQAVFQVKSYVSLAEPLSCFVSYAWVEERSVTDLKNAGINVILDRWHNAAIGSSISRFISRIEEAKAIITVGTPLYRRPRVHSDCRNEDGYFTTLFDLILSIYGIAFDDRAVRDLRAALRPTEMFS